MLKKLRKKFVCINMLMVFLILAATFFLVFHITKTNLEQETLQMLQSIAANPADPSQPGAAQQALNLPYFAVQISKSGEIMLVQNAGFDLSDEALLDRLIDIAFSTSETSGMLKSYHLRFFRLSTKQMQCIVFADTSSEEITLANLTRSCLIIGTMSLLVFFLLSLFLSRWAVRPVEQAWQQQKQFVSDASHELKTPLTVIMTNAEMLQSDLYSAAQKKTFGENILTMARQMRGLITAMLELARVENGAARREISAVCFSKLVADTVLQLEPVFFEKGLGLQSQITPDLTVLGNEVYLRQIAEILLDNAQKYARPASEVSLTLTQEGKSHCLLRVKNIGETIAPEAQKQIFTRFYRADPARAVNGSYGLGLPIAAQIVQDHHGKIWVESKHEETTFLVQLPLSALSAEAHC